MADNEKGREENKWEKVERLLREWEDAEAEAKRVTEQYISSGHKGLRGRIKWPPKILTSEGIDEMDAADAKAKKARDAYDKALKDAVS